MVMDDAIIDKIIARVMAQLSGEHICTKPRQVLILFSGARAGTAAGLEAIRRLSASKHTVSVMLTQAATAIIGEKAIREAGACTAIVDDPRVDVAGLACQSDLILVPTLTTRMAGYLALGLMESPVATLILRALLAGKRVIAIKDGADPDSQVSRKIYGAVPGVSPALYARLNEHLETLTSYGVELVAESDFLLRLEQRLIALPRQSNAVSHQDKARSPALAVQQAGAVEFITAGDLQRFARDQRIRLPIASRLTPQAEDVARQMRLEIEFV